MNLIKIRKCISNRRTPSCFDLVCVFNSFHKQYTCLQYLVVIDAIFLSIEFLFCTFPYICYHLDMYFYLKFLNNKFSIYYLIYIQYMYQDITIQISSDSGVCESQFISLYYNRYTVNPHSPIWMIGKYPQALYIYQIYLGTMYYSDQHIFIFILLHAIKKVSNELGTFIRFLMWIFISHKKKVIWGVKNFTRFLQYYPQLVWALF